MSGDNDFVVVANRLPVDQTESGWQPSPGGLVAALAPVLRRHAGCWVGWPGVADLEVAPFEFDGISLHPVALSQWEYENFYEGFSNSTLWPLYHDLVVKPRYVPQWWEAYKVVNTTFAKAAATVAAPGATVWVQDYQLQLVPGLLKEMRPDLTVGFFLHIPFPSPDLFKQLPWRREIAEGLQDCNLIGFQRETDERNFRALVGVMGPRTGAFPISIDPDAVHPAPAAEVAQLREKVGNPATFMLGVDRMDYTKGILQRLLAIEAMLERGELEDVTMVQIATPSRERIEHYRQTRRSVEEAVGRINGRFGEVGRPIIHYIHRPVPKSVLGMYYSAADIMVVTPFKDGMNLVAKEYVACHPDGDGALVLSEFAGASVELNQAHICNPFDVESIQHAIKEVLSQDEETAQAAMRSMHDHVISHDVTRWAQSFLEAL